MRICVIRHLASDITPLPRYMTTKRTEQKQTEVGGFKEAFPMAKQLFCEQHLNQPRLFQSSNQQSP
jgi:hypothetical protein